MPKQTASPMRVWVSLSNDNAGTEPLPVPSQKLWQGGLLVACIFIPMAVIAWSQISRLLHGRGVKTLPDLTSVLFESFWCLGWSAGVAMIGALMLLLFLCRESARLGFDRLIQITYFGPVRFWAEYALDRIERLRAEHNPGNSEPGVQIMFICGNKKRILGGQMPPAHAEKLLTVIRSAQAKVQGKDPSETYRPKPPGFEITNFIKKKAKPHPPRATGEDLSTAPPPRWTSPSTLALIGANLIPVFGVLFLGWDMASVMVLFWAESGIIGFYNVLKLIVVCKWGALFVAPFFVGHYGGFMAGHLLFIYEMFIKRMHVSGREEQVWAALGHIFGPVWPALIGLFVSHGISFFVNFIGHKEYEKANWQQLMRDPYQRIIVMHLTLILGGFLMMLLRAPATALVLLVVLKTIADVYAHRMERLRKL